MERVTKLESSVEEIKEMMKNLVQNSKAPPSNADIAKETWANVQPYLHLQKQVVEEKHNMHVELIRPMVDAKYKDSRAEVKSIKDFIHENTGKTLTLPTYEDDVKKGEKECMRKLPPLVKKGWKRPDIVALKKAKQKEIAKVVEKEKRRDTRKANMQITVQEIVERRKFKITKVLQQRFQKALLQHLSKL
ncbi:hypothetical protein Hanom_Chr16g01454841 [Helianthus anomalus]